MTKEDIIRLKDAAEQTRVQFFDKRSGKAECKEHVTRDEIRSVTNLQSSNNDLKIF